MFINDFHQMMLVLSYAWLNTPVLLCSGANVVGVLNQNRS